MKPELISFELCPFVQRSIITLKEKNVDFDVKYIDLANKPDWFLKISPLGKVPVLRIGNEVLFESAVINEYLDEVNPPSMHPKDPLKKAHNRAWIEFGSGILVSQYQMSLAENKEAFWEKKKEIAGKLARVEEQISRKYFNGDDFCLIDAAYAPVLVRLSILDKTVSLGFFDDVPKVRAWADTLIAMESVQKSVPENFENKFLDYIRNKESYMSSLVP